MKDRKTKRSRPSPTNKTRGEIEETFRRLNLPTVPDYSGEWPQFKKFTLLKNTELTIKPL